MPTRIASRIALLVMALSLCLWAQDEPKAVPLAPHARLMAARSVYIEHAGGVIPNDVIGDAFQGWGRYTVVGDPQRADLIVSINAPTADSGVSVGDGRSGSGGTKLSTSSVIQIRLTILDARDRVTLWNGNEQPKSSMKGRKREDNEVEASLRLFRRFRATIEPEPAP